MKLRLRVLTALLLLSASAGARAEGVIAIIVPPARAETRLAPADLSLIFERKKLYWADSRRIQPVNLPATDPLRVAFSRAIFGIDPVGLDDYWRERYFHGVRPPYVVASSEAMLRFVAETPDAIGYADACAVDQRVAAIGFLNDSGRYQATRPTISCPAAATVAE